MSVYGWFPAKENGRVKSFSILLVLWVCTILTDMVESSLFSTFKIPIPSQGSAVFFLVQEEKIRKVAKKMIEMAKADFFMGCELLIAKVQGFNQFQNNFVIFYLLTK